MFPQNVKNVGRGNFRGYAGAQQAKNAFEPPHDKTNKMTVRPAKTQSDQSLRCALNR